LPIVGDDSAFPCLRRKPGGSSSDSPEGVFSEIVFTVTIKRDSRVDAGRLKQDKGIIASTDRLAYLVNGTFADLSRFRVHLFARVVAHYIIEVVQVENHYTARIDGKMLDWVDFCIWRDDPNVIERERVGAGERNCKVNKPNHAQALDTRVLAKHDGLECEEFSNISRLSVQRIAKRRSITVQWLLSIRYKQRIDYHNSAATKIYLLGRVDIHFVSFVKHLISVRRALKCRHIFTDEHGIVNWNGHARWWLAPRHYRRNIVTNSTDRHTWGRPRIDPVCHDRGGQTCQSLGMTAQLLACGGAPLRRREEHSNRHPETPVFLLEGRRGIFLVAAVRL
jgi:hypothetical protein